MAESSIRELKIECREAVRAAVIRGELVRPEQCEECERVVELAAHHDDYAKPLEVRWLCRKCHAAEHKEVPGWVTAAQALRATGKTYKEISALLGEHESTVYKRLNPSRTAGYHRKSNKKRRAQKREWENKRHRDPDYRGECLSCGNRMGIGVAKDGVCQRCRSAESQMTPAGRALAERVAALWREGASLSEICAETGLTKGSLGGRMDYWREQGIDLPYRYGGERKFAAQQKTV